MIWPGKTRKVMGGGHETSY